MTDTLLQQILANPADDQARAVYADLLQARGDARGELIAIDLQLSRARTPDLVARKAALLAEHARRWWPAIAVEQLDVRRGFVERVAGTARQLEAASPMFETEPIERVELLRPGSRFEEASWQRRIRQLAVREAFDREGLVSLASCPLGDRLEALDLGNASMYRFPELGDALPRCRSLSVADNRLLGVRVLELRNWKHLEALDVLDARRCQIDPRTALALVEGLRDLRVLRLSGNPIGPDGSFLLARRLAELPQLRELDMIGCGVGADAARELADALPRVRIQIEMPRTVTLDLLGRELVFVHDKEALWRIEVDGIARRIEVTHALTTVGNTTDRSNNPPRVTHAGGGTAVEIEAVARALAEGAARSFDDRAAAKLELATSYGAVYNTSVWTSESARIAITPHAVEVRLEEYVDLSD